MKLQSWAALLALLVILQVYSVIKINALERQIDNLNYTISSVENRLGSQINNIHQNVEQKLQEQASLILHASAQVGEPDPNTLTVPVTFTVGPKTVTDTMSVSLDIDGELVPLERSGLEYSATREIKISQSISPTIVIEEGGERHLEAHRGLALKDLRERVFPRLFAHFVGQNSYGSNEYKQSGQLEIDYKPSQETVGFAEITYIVKIDGKTVSEMPISIEGGGPGGTFRSAVEDRYPLREGQTLTGHVVAVDSLGFTHEYKILHYLAGAGAQREPDFSLEIITAPNGEIIFEE